MWYDISIKTKTIMYDNYTIELEHGTRMEGGITEGKPLAPVEYTTYKIFREGKLVGLAFNEADAQTAIETMEKYPHAGRAMHNRFD